MRRVDRIKDWSQGKRQGPYNIQINISKECTLNCRFCWRYHEPKEFSKELYVSDKRLFKLIEECAELGVREVLLTGDGEPLTRKSLLLRLMSEIKKKGMYGSLTTNGTMFTEKDVKKIVEMSWDRIMISLQSPNELLQDYIRGVKGSFKKTLKTLRLFLEHKKEMGCEEPEIDFCPVVFNQNYKELKSLVELAKDYAVKKIFFTPIKGVSKNMKELRLSRGEEKELLNIVKEVKEISKRHNIFTDASKTLSFNSLEESNDMKGVMIEKMKYYDKIATEYKNNFVNLPCYEPWLGLVVDEYGHVGPCCERYGESDQENIKEKSLEKIWFGPYFKKFRDQISRRNFSDLCRFCGIWRFNINNDLREELIRSCSKNANKKKD